VPTWGPGEDPQCPPSARPALEKCLSEHGAYEGDAAEVDGGKLADLALIRIGNGQGTDVYVIAQRGGVWRAVKNAFYEQGHGKASGTLTLKGIKDEQIAGARVSRIDYHTAETVEDHTDEADAVMCCAWPAEGMPACEVSLKKDCAVANPKLP
jgi:hypothetical protein